MAPKQMTLASEMDSGFALQREARRRGVFLAEMDKVVPWSALCALIESHDPKVCEDSAGRRPIGLERMLRIHFLQQWYALSDSGVEEALYDSEVMRRFVGIDLAREAAPDESAVLQFRQLLERHGLAKQILAEVKTAILTCPNRPTTDK
jgi:IS5 family transposase